MAKKEGHNVNKRKKPSSKGGSSMELVHNTAKKQADLETVLRKMLPHVGSNLNALVLTQVMVVLKLENVIGEDISTDDSKQMIKVIKNSIMNDPDKRHQTLRLIQKLLK